jgi:hypothetical protein
MQARIDKTISRCCRCSSTRRRRTTPPQHWCQRREAQLSRPNAVVNRLSYPIGRVDDRRGNVSRSVSCWRHLPGLPQSRLAWLRCKEGPTRLLYAGTRHAVSRAIGHANR